MNPAQSQLENPGTRLAFAENGAISQWSVPSEDGGYEIMFRSDEFGGPSWYIDQNETQQRVALQPADLAGAFTGTLDDLQFRLEYELADPNILVIQASLRNEGSTAFAPTACGIKLGLDTYMVRAPDWDGLYFPTLLRCEKSHFWGYCMSPLGRILGIASPDPLAAWSMDYNFAIYGTQRHEGHRIYTFNLALLHALPLPERHPQDLTRLMPGESKTWTLFLVPLQTLEQVKPALAGLCAAPLIDCDRHTLAPGETTHLQVFSPVTPVLALNCPNGTSLPLPVRPTRPGWYETTFEAGEAAGVYTIAASTTPEKQTEAKLYVRRPWSWYLRQARAEALTKPQKASTHMESWLGFFSAFLARKHFPDAAVDEPAEAQFRAALALMYDIEKAQPVIEGGRIQNTAAMIGLLTDLYEAGGNPEDLDLAARLADWLIQCQDSAGAYRAFYGNGVHYTSVTYLAKYILELALVEQRLGESHPLWQERYQRHYRSAQAAVADLENLRDRIGTEGEHTFEDGMISCTAAQLAQFAVLQTDSHERQKYSAAARQVLQKHRCLEQLLIPDCRMHGATLRFWEAQYDVLIKHNMFNSPHGWTSWKTYATWYLYLLTGEEELLRQTMDTLGACVQVIDLERGELRWGFVSDPYIPTPVFRPTTLPGVGQYQETVLGEQYVEMISGWWQAPAGVATGGYWDPGGCCDNDVHEHFKCLEEVALTSAYVLERLDGSLTCWNCRAMFQDAILHVFPSEEIVSAVHCNLHSPGNGIVHFHAQPVVFEHPGPGMFWVK